MAPEIVEANDAEKKAKQAEADAANAARTGVGTRVRVGQTRGRNPNVITWEAFDESQPDTLPKTPAEFVAVTKISSEAQLAELLIVGYNDAQYSQASDEIGEFINPSWSKELQAQFRMVVRNYAKATGKSIEDAVSLIKPGIEAAHSAK